MPATCPNCGHGINRGDRFCDSCGTYLDWAPGISAGESQVIPRETLIRAREQRAAVQLELASDMIKVTPGSAEASAFTVKNQGTQVEEFHFTVSGPEWIAAEPPVMSIYPGQDATGALQVAPPRAPSSLAGVVSFLLTATSAVHANVSATVAGRAEVAPYFELTAELVPTSTSGRGLTTHRVTLANQGNLPLRLPLKPDGVAPGLRVGVPAYADVWPGKVTEVPVPVRGSRRWFGRPESKAFTVVVDAPKPLSAIRLPGARIVGALLPGWVPAVAGLAVVLAAASGVVVPKLMANNSSSPPIPTATSATTASSASPVPTTSAPASSASASASMTSGSTSTSQAGNASVTSTTAPAPPPPPLVDMVATASTAMWSSRAVNVPEKTDQVQQGTGCQPQTPPGSEDGAVAVQDHVLLEDNSWAPVLLETDPPLGSTSTLTGTYTFSATTTPADFFRAEVGFCAATPPTAAMEFFVYLPSSSQPATSGTVYASAGRLTKVEVQLPAQTSQVRLVVEYVQSDGTYASVIWADPRIEVMNAPAPTQRPTSTLPLPTPT